MALIATCAKCGLQKWIDTHCSRDFSDLCCDCLDAFPELGGHKPDCPTAVRRAKNRAVNIIRLHEMIDKENAIILAAQHRIASLSFALRTIDPCRCGERDCPGYKNVTAELEAVADAPDPPVTYY